MAVTVTLHEQGLSERVAALMASELAAAVGEDITVEAALMQKVLEAHVRAQLDSPAEIRTGLG